MKSRELELQKQMLALQRRVEALETQESLVFGPPQDFSSVLVGWSSTTEETIWYKRGGNTIFLYFRIIGTSNLNSTTFTIPFDGREGTWINIILAANSGVWDIGWCKLPPGSDVVTCYHDPAGSTWATSGSKQVFGVFFYETG